MGGLHRLGLPVLMAVSRKDFIGALMRRPPRERLAGTLAAVGHGAQLGAHIFRVHDVAATADYLRVCGMLQATLSRAGIWRSPRNTVTSVRRDRLPQEGG